MLSSSDDNTNSRELKKLIVLNTAEACRAKPCWKDGGLLNERSVDHKTHPSDAMLTPLSMTGLCKLMFQASAFKTHQSFYNHFWALRPKSASILRTLKVNFDKSGTLIYSNPSSHQSSYLKLFVGIMKHPTPPTPACVRSVVGPLHWSVCVCFVCLFSPLQSV